MTVGGPPDRDETAHVESAMDAIARAMDDDAAEIDGPEADRSMIEQALERGIRALEAEGEPPILAVRESVSALVGQIYGARGRHEAREAREARLDDDEDGAQGAWHRLWRDRAARFLQDTKETGAADPHLRAAREAQRAMERHIGAVFQGDAAQIDAAIRESRRRIADALGQGLDVSRRKGGARR